MDVSSALETCNCSGVHVHVHAHAHCVCTEEEGRHGRKGNVGRGRVMQLSHIPTCKITNHQKGINSSSTLDGRTYMSNATTHTQYSATAGEILWGDFTCRKRTPPDLETSMGHGRKYDHNKTRGCVEHQQVEPPQGKLLHNPPSK